MPTGTHSQSIPYIFSYYAENFNPEHPTFPHWLISALCNSNYHNLIIPYFPVTFHIAADVAATVLTF